MDHSVCLVIFLPGPHCWPAFRGCILNQIRTLKRYSWLASSAIWLNLLVIFLSMGFVAHSAPNYVSAKSSYGIAKGPVHTQSFASYPFFQRINGVMNIGSSSYHIYSNLSPNILSGLRVRRRHDIRPDHCWDASTNGLWVNNPSTTSTNTWLTLSSLHSPESFLNCPSSYLYRLLRL